MRQTGSKGTEPSYHSARKAEQKTRTLDYMYIFLTKYSITNLSTQPRAFRAAACDLQRA
jgi:hypothetical protein